MGEDADNLLTNHRSKLLYPSGLSDLATIDYFRSLIGDEHIRSDLDERRGYSSAARNRDRTPSNDRPVPRRQRPAPSESRRCRPRPRRPPARMDEGGSLRLNITLCSWPFFACHLHFNTSTGSAGSYLRQVDRISLDALIANYLSRDSKRFQSVDLRVRRGVHVGAERGPCLAHWP